MNEINNVEIKKRIDEIKSETEVKVVAIAIKCLNIPEEKQKSIGMHTHFTRDLNADSLDLVEIVMNTEDEFDISIPDEDAQKIETVKDAYDYVVRKKLENEDLLKHEQQTS